MARRHFLIACRVQKEVRLNYHQVHVILMKQFSFNSYFLKTKDKNANASNIKIFTSLHLKTTGLLKA